MIDPAIGILVIACFATLFGVSGLHKLRDPAAFGAVFAAYDLGPSRASLAVPLIELAVALGLLLGEGFRRTAAVVGILLFVTYAGAIGVNLFRGRRDLSCGCGFGNTEPIAPWMVARSLMLAVLLAGTLLPWKHRDLTVIDLLTIGFGLASMSLLYLCIERLLGQTARRLDKLRSVR